MFILLLKIIYISEKDETTTEVAAEDVPEPEKEVPTTEVAAEVPEAEKEVPTTEVAAEVTEAEKDVTATEPDKIQVRNQCRCSGDSFLYRLCFVHILFMILYIFRTNMKTQHNNLHRHQQNDLDQLGCLGRWGWHRRCYVTFRPARKLERKSNKRKKLKGRIRVKMQKKEKKQHLRKFKFKN